MEAFGIFILVILGNLASFACGWNKGFVDGLKRAEEIIEEIFENHEKGDTTED